MTDDKMYRLATCIGMICDPMASKNPVAWFELEQEGVTREGMLEQVEKGNWMGPTPRFEDAPDREGAMWKALEAQSGPR